LRLLIYVILDGSTWVGAAVPLSKDEGERDVMMNSVAQIWERETRRGCFWGVAACRRSVPAGYAPRAQCPCRFLYAIIP